MILLWTFALIVVPSSFAALHPTSLCPNVFSYEGTQPENERWYGVVLLSTDESLVGVWIEVKLDRPAEILVSWMGSVTTKDNELFRILSLDQKLHPGPPVASRFMVKFNAVKGSPQVRTIRLNGRQICPPDPNFATDVQQNNQDHLYENRFTTERITRRPDLDFDDDWTNPQSGAPSRTPSTGDAYKPPKRQNPSSHEDNTKYSNHKTSNGNGYSTHENTGSHLEKQTVRTTTYSYNSHESYNSGGNHRPPTSSSNTYNTTKLVSSTNPDHRNTQMNPHPLETYNTQSNGALRPSINININKDVTYNVDRPDIPSYSGSDNKKQSGVSRPSDSYVNNQYPKTTERYSEQNSGGRVDEIYIKPTTKKPVVFNNINININSGNSESQSEGSSYKPSKTSTRRPYISPSRNNITNNNHPTTHKPSSSNQKLSSNNYQGSRPNRNPDIPSSEDYYGQNEHSSHERTTETNHHQSNYGSNHNQNNHKTSNTEFVGNLHPRPIPSSRPIEEEKRKIPKPHTSTTSKHGGKGDLEVNSPNIKCGKVEVNPAPLITHGQNTARGQWPWHIALYRVDGINLSYSCGGSLISSTVVITAAHCVTKAPRDRPVDADILVVQLGKYHLYQFSDDSVQNKQVQEIYVHPRYNSTNYLDDLAILVLSSAAEFTKYVRPVCLWPKHNFNLQTIDGKEGTVVGWGYDENNQVTEELKMARMPVVSYVTCLKSYPQFFSQFTSENKTFCAGFRQGTSVCNGDSGGGMVFQHDNTWYLRGLVSITVAKQGLRVCDTNHYVVFTDIANYFEWINRFISS